MRGKTGTLIRDWTALFADLVYIAMLTSPKGLLLTGFIATGIAMICAIPALAQELESEEDQAALGSTYDRRIATGILPQLAVALRLPENYRLYEPDDPSPTNEPVEYTRRFPIGGAEVIKRGYALPLPVGITVIGVNNVQDQDITELNIALGKGVVPPEDVELRPFPAVTIDSTSDTTSLQIKGDLWVLPFLNVYATLGKITGDANITVNIDLADAEEICIPNPLPPLPGQPDRPPICSDFDQSGSFLLPITSSVDRDSVTLGLLGAFSVGRWFGSVTGSFTDSFGGKASDIDNISASARAGRRLIFGNNNLLTPYFGISYLDIDTRVQGVATLRDAFPDGDDLNVRYDIQLDNVDKFSGLLGFNIGLQNGFGFQFEWNKSARSERFVLSGGYRF